MNRAFTQCGTIKAVLIPFSKIPCVVSLSHNRGLFQYTLVQSWYMWLLRLILVLASNDIARRDFRETIIFSLVGNQAAYYGTDTETTDIEITQRGVPSKLSLSRDKIVKRSEISCRVWIKQVHLNNLFCKLTQYVTLSYTLYLSRYATIAHTLMLKITKRGGAKYRLRKNTAMDSVVVICCLASHRLFPRPRIGGTEVHTRSLLSRR